MNGKKKIIVIGGGISGLSLAYFLKKAGHDITLLEARSRVGGVIHSERIDGFLIEHGPNGTLETNKSLTQLIQDLGLKPNKIYASKSAKNRYIVRGGKLIPLPLNPFHFLTSPLFSLKTKLGLLKEPFIPRSAHDDESISDFVVRRLGQEFLDYAVNPFISGVYAGNPKNLSLRSSLPKLYALEQKYGSLIKGTLRGRRERKRRNEISKDRAFMISFQNGMAQLTERLYERLKENVCLNIKNLRIEKKENGYRVAHQSEGAERNLVADSVVMTTPAYETAKLIGSMNQNLADRLASITYAPIAIITMGFQKKSIAHPLNGFGFLVPEIEKRNILGTLFSSSLFHGRAPEGGTLLTTFIGGMRQPKLVELDDKEMTNMVRGELKNLIGLESEEPSFVRVKRIERAIPQYHLGYWKILGAMERFESENAGLFITGNFRGGVSVVDCVLGAADLAERMKQNPV